MKFQKKKNTGCWMLQEPFYLPYDDSKVLSLHTLSMAWQHSHLESEAEDAGCCKIDFICLKSIQTCYHCMHALRMAWQHSHLERKKQRLFTLAFSAEHHCKGEVQLESRHNFKTFDYANKHHANIYHASHVVCIVDVI